MVDLEGYYPTATLTATILYTRGFSPGAFSQGLAGKQPLPLFVDCRHKFNSWTCEVTLSTKEARNPTSLSCSSNMLSGCKLTCKSVFSSWTCEVTLSAYQRIKSMRLIKYTIVSKWLGKQAPKKSVQVGDEKLICSKFHIITFMTN